MLLPNNIKSAYCERVIDGDTYHLRVDLTFHVATTIPVRLRGMDTPEMNTPEGVAARDFVVALLRPQNLRWGPSPAPPTPLVIQSFKDRQTFNRWVCDIWLPDTGEHLSEVLLKAGHGTMI